jgi:septal ring factor EnvC (AmiA/AmiB activator)
VNDYTAELEQFSIEIQALQEKKMKIMNRRRTSVDKVKIFHQLSDLALSFRSKLLLREELKKNLKNAESELEDLFRKVNEEQEKLQIIEAENESDKKYASRYEVDLDELQKNIEKKKKSLEKLLGEKKALISDEGNKEGFEEGETVFLSGWVNGMNEMQKEKISLMEENFKLKERISRLYSPKA